MNNNKIENNLLLLKIIENSAFTERQIQIIYNIYNGEERLKEITSGAYYREVKQCKNKIRKLYYSFILLHLLNIFNNEQLLTINSVIDKLYRLQNNHEKYHENNIKAVINVIDKLIDKMLSQN
jgi:hypothetical protein